jgi:hypothetical protein
MVIKALRKLVLGKEGNKKKIQAALQRLELSIIDQDYMLSII